MGCRPAWVHSGFLASYQHWQVLVASKSGGTVETRNALVETKAPLHTSDTDSHLSRQLALFKAFFFSHGVDFASKSLAITCAGSRLDR